MPPIPMLTGVYANLATEGWILQERQEIRSLHDVKLIDFHQSYVDDVSWLNEYMTTLCERGQLRGDILTTMKTPSRFQSVRKLNMTFDLKGVKPVGRLVLEPSVDTGSLKTVSLSPEGTKSTGACGDIQPQNTALKTGNRCDEVRGSMIIYHDPQDEPELIETGSAEKPMGISERDQGLRRPVEEQMEQPNEAVEEEEEDEVVTVLKTPRPDSLQPKPSLPAEEVLPKYPVAGKDIPRLNTPQINEDIYFEGSDKENIPFSPVKKPAPATPRRSERSDSFVTAQTNFLSEDCVVPQQSHSQDETMNIPSSTNTRAEHTHEDEMIDALVPVASSPPQMQLPSLPSRAPLNMKKSFGVRKSQRTSFMESLAGRTSIIPRMTFFNQIAQSSERPSTIVEPAAKTAEARTAHAITAAVTPVEETANLTTGDDVEHGKKDKDDTITIIDTELHLGDQRLRSKFTTESQRIQDALNSLRTKSTPGQALRDTQERALEATPASVRSAKGQMIDGDEEEDWTPKTDDTSLTDRLACDEPIRNQKMEDVMKPATTEINDPEKSIEMRLPKADLPGAVVITDPTISHVPEHVSTATVLAPPAASPASAVFKNAAAQAVEAIRNAMAVIANPISSQPPHPPTPKATNIYPKLTDDDHEEMTEIQVNENLSVHYDRQSLESGHDSTYFTQSDGPSQPDKVDVDPPSQVPQLPPSQTIMPPPRKEPPLMKPKPVPINIKVATASQRQKEQQKKAMTYEIGIYPTLTQSKSVPDLLSPGKVVLNEARMSSISVQSTGGFMRGGGQIKSLNAAKLAKQREEQERERKALKKFEMDKKRQDAVQKKQEEQRKQLPARGKAIAKGIKKGPTENLRPAKKLPQSPKKQVREEVGKQSQPVSMTVHTTGVKHPLEVDENKPRAVNYAAAGKSMGQSQHAQDVKRRRTDENSDEVVATKPMRSSVVKPELKPTKSIGEPIRQPYAAEPKKGIKMSSAHQHAHPAKSFMAPAEGVKFSNDPIPFGKPNMSQGKRSGPGQPQPPKDILYPASESIILPEIDSEYSDSDDDSPRKPTMPKPSWAESPVLLVQLTRQQAINPDDVFGEIRPPAIDDIFRDTKRRGHSTFRPRSSSANWSGQDKLSKEEIEEYAKMMGYSKP